jgi:hypothetical protein
LAGSFAREISDRFWEVVAPLLEPFERRRPGGSKPLDFRTVLIWHLLPAEDRLPMGLPTSGIRLEEHDPQALPALRGWWRLYRDIPPGSRPVQGTQSFTLAPHCADGVFSGRGV